MNLLGTQKISVGSMIEVGWCDAWRKPLILVMEPGNIHEHAMVDAIKGFQVPTLEEGLKICKTVLGL